MIFWKKKEAVKKKASPTAKSAAVPKSKPSSGAPLKKKTMRKLLTAEGWKRLMMKKTGKK